MIDLHFLSVPPPYISDSSTILNSLQVFLELDVHILNSEPSPHV